MSARASELAHRASELLQGLLADLLKHARADLLTAHFRNAYSGNFWLLEKLGDFRQECSVHGPLTLRRQIERMGDRYAPHPTSDPDTTFDYFKEIPETFRTNVLAGPSFVHREGIRHSVRICIRDKGSVQDSVPTIVVFLSYRTSGVFPSPEGIQALIDARIGVLKPMLLFMAREPRLNSETALKLRSLVWTLQRDLAGPLESGAGVRALYRQVTRCAFDLVAPERGKNVICTLHKMDVANELQLLDSYPVPPLGNDQGVVDYVGHSGILHLINDIPKYRAEQVQRERSAIVTDAPHPPYVEYHRESKSGIACPMIVQNRVIGVLNLEGDATNGYRDPQLLMLWQLAGIAAMAVRQGVFSEGSADAMDMQQAQLLCTNIKGVFEETAKAVRRLGYHHASVWDVTSSEWRGNEDDPHPRKDHGYTAEVIKRRTPLVLADLKPVRHSEIDGRLYLGALSSKLLFKGWGDEQRLPFELSDGTKQYVYKVLKNTRSRWNVVTDLALPIFKDPTNPSSDVVGVLWATTRRHFLSLLDDEVWRLSSMCRLTSVSLAVVKAKSSITS